MISKDSLINSIFYTRTTTSKDENDHLVEVEDNISVGVRLYFKDKTFNNILFFHGNAELAHEYSDIASFFHSFNLNLIVADYRGYGLSGGVPTKDNLQTDSIIIFDYIKDYLNKNNFYQKLYVMGRSLGSASAAHIVNNREDQLDGCIIESGFATEYCLLELMNIDPNDISFSLVDGFDNLKKFKKYKKPLLIIHADLDDIIPISQADMLLVESGSAIKDMFKVDGANHNNIIMMAREEYFMKIRDFIEST